MVTFEDRFGRKHDDLRISVTDRCNLRCAYCLPEEPQWFPRGEILDYEELLRLVRITLRHGVRRLRVTGGEPLVRRDLPEFVRMLAREPGVEDLSLTTNGVRLEALAADLVRAGLQRINVSLDTLDAARFEALTRRPALEQVLRGIEAAVAAGLAPIKVNAVLTRGANDDEAERLVAHARRHGWELRFIEYMPLENGQGWNLDRVVSGESLRRRIHALWPIEPDPASDPRAPATRYRFRDGCGHVGFIDSVHRPFCATCSRLRLTSDGKFRVCLYDPAEVDLKGPLRSGASDEAIGQIMQAAVRAKGRGGAIDILERQQAPTLSRTMHQIGG